MPTPTYLLVFFIILFTLMSVVFAAAGLSGYLAPNRGALERHFSLCLGLVVAIGFMRLAIESADRMH